VNDLDDCLSAAEEAGLRYVSDSQPGIQRRRRGKGFTYVGPDGSTIGDDAVRARIAALAIPPAWTDVWICPRPNGHILATGRDARGRKQYKYHADWRAVRDAAKYERLAAFGEALPKLRRRVVEDLSGRGFSKEKALALVVRLLDDTLIRVGNDEYAASNESFGLTTMRPDHVAIADHDDRVTFEFVGKSGLPRRLHLRDRRLARVVRRCSELGGQELFAYRDEGGSVVGIGSDDVNQYLREVGGAEFTSKYFRTWGGTCAAGAALAVSGSPSSARVADKQVLAALDVAAAVLGNTRAVCRSCYVHPAVLDAYREGELQDAWNRARGSKHLARQERMVLTVLSTGS
jgi:DNA topoisomerase-1